MKRAIVILTIVSACLAVAVIYLAATRTTPSVTNSGPARRILHYRNPMNPAETSPTPKKAPDGMDYVPVYAEGEGTGAPAPPGEIRIDPSIVQDMGITTITVEPRDLNRAIRTSGQIVADQTRLHEITAKVGGYIDKLFVDYVGQKVTAGDPLLEIYSPDVLETEQEYLNALRNDPTGELAASARRRLELWSIPADEIAEIAARGEPRRTVLLRAPETGVVIEKDVAQGAAITPGMRLFQLADLSRVWVEAQVFEYQLPWVKVGEAAQFELPYFPGRDFSGTVSYIDPTLSPETRTAMVRIELPNTSDAVLRPGMFATVHLLVPPLRDALVIPDQAVLRSGDRTVVVVALGNGLFASRDVVLGVNADSLDQVISGLNPGDQVVTSGQFLIDSESNLRAALKTIAPPQAGPAASAAAAEAHPAAQTHPTPAHPEAPPESMPPMPGMPGMH